MFTQARLILDSLLHPLEVQRQLQDTGASLVRAELAAVQLGQQNTALHRKARAQAQTIDTLRQKIRSLGVL